MRSALESQEILFPVVARNSVKWFERHIPKLETRRLFIQQVNNFGDRSFLIASAKLNLTYWEVPIAEGARQEPWSGPISPSTLRG